MSALNYEISKFTGAKTSQYYEAVTEPRRLQRVTRDQPALHSLQAGEADGACTRAVVVRLRRADDKGRRRGSCVSIGFSNLLRCGKQRPIFHHLIHCFLAQGERCDQLESRHVPFQRRCSGGRGLDRAHICLSSRMQVVPRRYRWCLYTLQWSSVAQSDRRSGQGSACELLGQFIGRRLGLSGAALVCGQSTTVLWQSFAHTDALSTWTAVLHFRRQQLRQ